MTTQIKYTVLLQEKKQVISAHPCNKLTWISGSLCTATYFAGCLATEEGSELVPGDVCVCVFMHVCVYVCVCVCVRLP